jgi:Tat protein secretion system quality control protein TatD with DNase activity
MQSEREELISFYFICSSSSSFLSHFLLSMTIDEFSDAYESWLIRTLSHPKCVALGEIGLDYHKFKDITYADPQLQRKCFLRQVKLAIERNKP